MKKTKLRINGHAVDWKTPANLLKEFEPEPFAPDCVPKELRAYPMLLSEATGADISLLLTSAVACAAAAIDDGVQIVADAVTNWRQSARLWVIIIDLPGSQKTPMQKTMVEPLWMLHDQMITAEMRRWEALSDEERKLPENKTPHKVRLIVSDITVEALGSILEHCPRGVLVWSEEVSSLLGGFDRYRHGAINKDRGDWLMLYDGGPRVIERVGRGSLHVPNWSVGVLTATTPDTMQRVAAHLPEDGLIQRFIVVYPRPQHPKHAVPKPRMDRARREYIDALKALFHVPTGLEVAVSPPAKRLFDDWCAENREDQEAFEGTASAYRSHLAKLPQTVLRIALVFHLAAGNRRGKLSADTMTNALRFISCVKSHVTKLHMSKDAGSEAYVLARHVARYMLSRIKVKREFTRRDFTMLVDAFRRADEQLQSNALRVLGDAYWLQASATARGRETRFAPNPALAKMFSEQAEAERRAREARHAALQRALRK